MKPLKNLFFSILVFELLFSCTTKENHNDLLRKVMIQCLESYKFLSGKPYKDTTLENGDIFFYVETEADRYSLQGSYQEMGDYLIFNLYEIYDDGISEGALTGIYQNDGKNWHSIFQKPLVNGSLDTIIDLNNDNVNEIIMNVTTTKARGKDPCNKLVLYAQKNSSLLEEVGVLAERINSEFKLIKDYTLSYETTGKSVILVINSIEGDDLDNDAETNPDINDNPPKTTTHRFSWEPPLLVDLNKFENLKVSFDDQRRMATNQDVSIGDQTWMVTNLDVTTFRNGDSIPQAKTEDEWNHAGQNQKPAWCNYGEGYSKWYNWYAVNDPRGLAPDGWHIPSDAEWNQLVDFLGGGKSAIAKLKSKDGWDSKEAGNDESGFSAKPDGSFDGTWEFSCGIGISAAWWSSTQDSTNRAWSWQLIDTSIYHTNKTTMDRGFSVRCIKDK